ncbi:MAG: polysaccharide deacetylase family protein [Clostridia bacterium]
MKKLLIGLLAATLIFTLALPSFALGEAEKYDAMPELFAITVEQQERKIDGNRAYVCKETLTTTSQKVNDELRALVDHYDSELSPSLWQDPRKNGKRNSRLDIEIVYYRTGESWLSTLVIARITRNLEPVSVAFTTRVFDLRTGERIMLDDIFASDSAAWSILQNGVRQHFASLFPDAKRDSAAIDALCTREALAQADFTLSGMELTLHYQAGTVVPDKTCLAHVRFFYPQLSGMMTAPGTRGTDNSRWKMVAVTCDDGPNYNESFQALTAFRRVGARVTYFVVGKKLVNYSGNFIKEFDQNHSMGSHSYHHWSGYSMKPATRLKELELCAEMTEPLVGERAKLFRAPSGTYPPWIEAGMPVPIIQWSLDTYDYTGKDPQHIFYSVRNNVKEGDIILCHDTGLQLYKAVPIFADYLTKHGFMMVTVEELAMSQNVKLEPNALYHRCYQGETRPRPDGNLN